MVIIAVLCLIAGILCGGLSGSGALTEVFSEIADYSLYLLMLSVGISVGMSKTVFQKLKQYRLTVLLIPMGVVLGSILAGLAGGILLGMPLADSVAITSGMGWYSLSGVMLDNMSGPAAGTVAFFSNLLREILSFLLIPFLAKKVHPYAAIAAAGATSEDTTLPMIIRYTDEGITVVAMLSGVICSTMVPLCITFFHFIFQRFA